MKSIASPIRQSVILHDHWLALLATSVEIPAAITTPLLLLQKPCSKCNSKKIIRLQEKSTVGNLSDKKTYEFKKKNMH